MQIGALVSQMRQKRCEWLDFSKVPGCVRQGLGAVCHTQHPSGWGCKRYRPKWQQGAGDGSGAMAWRACPLVHHSQPYPLVRVLIFLNKPKSLWVSVLLGSFPPSQSPWQNGWIKQMWNRRQGTGEGGDLGRALSQPVRCWWGWMWRMGGFVPLPGASAALPPWARRQEMASAV